MIKAAVILEAVAQHLPNFGIILVLLVANVAVGYWEEHQTFHRHRQSTIDEELFDLISGFEAMKG